MAEAGIVGEQRGSKDRELLISLQEWESGVQKPNAGVGAEPGLEPDDAEEDAA